MKALLLLLVSLLLGHSALQADTHTDLQELQAEITLLDSELSALTLHQDASCQKLGTINSSIQALTTLVENASQNMSAFSVSDLDMDAMDTLSAKSYSMAQASVRLSLELFSIKDMAELFEYKAALNAILQLSTDIGTMADRILAMADRILIMADNINEMAGRIIITQQIQNANIALTQRSILTTQENMIALSNSLSTIFYNLTLGQIQNDSDQLSSLMSGTILDSSNLSSKLDSFELTTTALLNNATNLLFTLVDNSSKMSHYINSDTLAMLGDLSTIYKALAQSLEIFSVQIEQIAPLVETPILSDATQAMLRLAEDIGLMSDRIMEMTRKIYIMADNIGLMADNIVLTQNLQKENVLLTQSSLLASQNMMINLIKNFGL